MEHLNKVVFLIISLIKSVHGSNSEDGHNQAFSILDLCLPIRAANSGQPTFLCIPVTSETWLN